MKKHMVERIQDLYVGIDNDLSARREHGKTPQGNELNGRWVLRDSEGNWIDHDQYRSDLFSRHGILEVETGHLLDTVSKYKARIAELEAAVQWAGWMPLDQAPQGELMLFCDMNATELRASFFVDWMVGGKFCGNRHHTATHCMKLPPAPTANAMQINDLGEKSANDTPTATPWYPDDSGEWVAVPENLARMPAGLSPEALVAVLTENERETRVYIRADKEAGHWNWGASPNLGCRIVAYKVVKQ